MTYCDPIDQVQIRPPGRRRITKASSDAFGSTIAAIELPRECKPPYQGRTVWDGEHRGWRIIVRRLQHDPVAHVVVSGHGRDGKFYAHAARREGATPATVRQWIDSLIAADLAS